MNTVREVVYYAQEMVWVCPCLVVVPMGESCVGAVVERGSVRRLLGVSDVMGMVHILLVTNLVGDNLGSFFCVR